MKVINKMRMELVKTKLEQIDHIIKEIEEINKIIEESENEEKQH